MRCAIAGTILAAILLADEPAQGPATPIRADAVHNLFRLGPGLYSGAQPEGRAGLEALKRLGIRTIISVDGAEPDVEAARALGLRYVHLPVGYDGIHRDPAVRLQQAARTLPGPIFVHCHHGLHRGPAAAAICARAAQDWDADRADAWLKQAGTSPAYRGLFETVHGHTPATAEELEAAGTDFAERVEPPALVEWMIEIDARWDRIKAVRAAGFAAPASDPELDPAREGLLLAEQFRELTRREILGRDHPGLAARAEPAALAADRLEAALRHLAGSPADPPRKREAEAAFTAVARQCTDCHAQQRDRAAGPG